MSVHPSILLYEDWFLFQQNRMKMNSRGLIIFRVEIFNPFLLCTSDFLRQYGLVFVFHFPQPPLLFLLFLLLFLLIRFVLISIELGPKTQMKVKHLRDRGFKGGLSIFVFYRRSPSSIGLILSTLSKMSTAFLSATTCPDISLGSDPNSRSNTFFFSLSSFPSSSFP